MNTLLDSQMYKDFILIYLIYLDEFKCTEALLSHW